MPMGMKQHFIKKIKQKKVTVSITVRNLTKITPMARATIGAFYIIYGCPVS